MQEMLLFSRFFALFPLICNILSCGNSKIWQWNLTVKSVPDFTAKFNCLNSTAVLRKAQNTWHKQLPAAQTELMWKTLSPSTFDFSIGMITTSVDFDEWLAFVTFVKNIGKTTSSFFLNIAEGKILLAILAAFHELKSRNSKSTILKPETTMSARLCQRLLEVYFAALGNFAVD